MRRITFTLSAIAVSALYLLCATAAQAQVTRTWVSGTGDDVNPCSRTSPCRTFAGALSKTAEGGEISALNPGSYGPVTITKAVTVNGAETLAGINAASTNGVVVNVTTNPSTATVILRNLAINGLQSGSAGIRYQAGKTLMVDHCWIYGFTNSGINADVAVTSNLKVIDTIIEDIFGFGIYLTCDASAQLLATIENTRITDCGLGLVAVDHVRSTISHCILTHNINAIMTHATGTDSILNIDHLDVSYCGGTAVQGNGSGSEIRVSDSMIAQNNVGVAGNVHSFQGNSLVGNSTNGSFVTTTAKQ